MPSGLLAGAAGGAGGPFANVGMGRGAVVLFDTPVSGVCGCEPGPQVRTGLRHQVAVLSSSGETFPAD